MSGVGPWATLFSLCLCQWSRGGQESMSPNRWAKGFRLTVVPSNTLSDSKTRANLQVVEKT